MQKPKLLHLTFIHLVLPNTRMSTDLFWSMVCHLKFDAIALFKIIALLTIWSDLLIKMLIILNLFLLPAFHMTRPYEYSVELTVLAFN